MAKEAKIFFRKTEIFRYLRDRKYTDEKKPHTHVLNKEDKRIVIGNINVWLFRKNPENDQYEREYMLSIFDTDWLDAIKEFENT